MIRIIKLAAPTILLSRGAAATQSMCAAFDALASEFAPKFDASIYAHTSVKHALKSAQFKKCAFCESHCAHTSYGDVEHFRPKAGYQQRESDDLKRPGYYWLAYAWENLFWCCQLCNQRFKRNLFPLKDGRKRARSHSHRIAKEEALLIDPSANDPTAFIGFRQEYAFAIDGCEEGKTTMEVLGLNREEMAEIRRDRLQSLDDLARICETLRDEEMKFSTKKNAADLREYEARLVAKADPSSEYSAMIKAFLAARAASQKA